MKGYWDVQRNMHPDVKLQTYDFIDHVTSSEPTCEDLGIPRDDACTVTSSLEIAQKPLIGPELRYHVAPKLEKDPFSPMCMIPLPSPFGMGVFDSTCFRRRNERERDRVRCVNDGYIKLKQHLPIENKEKRLSKVETLRYAISYIKYLEELLNNDENESKMEPCKRRKLCVQTDKVNVTTKLSNGNIAGELSDGDLDLSTDTSDYESKCDDASSDADVSE